jgi:hypothetical protein
MARLFGNLQWLTLVFGSSSMKIKLLQSTLHPKQVSLLPKRGFVPAELRA